MNTIVISASDIRCIVADIGIDAVMDEMIKRLDKAIREFEPSVTVSRARDGFHYRRPELGLLEWMPVMNGGRVTIKVVGYHPSNPSIRSLPTILSTISVYDTGSGHLVGLADGTFLTALRTGAASAVASRLMARPDSQTVGLIGCGAQAVTQLHALSRTFELTTVLLYDIDSQEERSFIDRVECLKLQGVTISAAPLDHVVASADILCTATSIGIGEGPLFDGIGTKPWIHVNATGSDFTGKFELPASLLERAFICPDVRDQCIREGECQHIRPDRIGPDLAELAKHEHRYRHVRDQPSVFDSTGWSLEDHVAMTMLLHHAERLGLGSVMPLETIGVDPRNPYHFITM
jgi:ornithine cyclodeaminase